MPGPGFRLKPFLRRCCCFDGQCLGVKRHGVVSPTHDSYESTLAGVRRQLPAIFGLIHAADSCWHQTRISWRATIQGLQLMPRTPPEVLGAYTASDARSEGQQYWTPVKTRLVRALRLRQAPCHSPMPIPIPLSFVHCSLFPGKSRVFKSSSEPRHRHGVDYEATHSLLVR